MQLVEGLLGEAGSHAPRVDERAVAVIAHQQRADAPGAPALAGDPAADHELLTSGVLDLQPRTGAAARLVVGVQALGDDPLEALRRRRLEQAPAGVADARWARARPVPRARAASSRSRRSV